MLSSILYGATSIIYKQVMATILSKKLTSKYLFENGLIILFFLSGFSALCYQIVWQRLLFATFGINIESVTIIVSLFMFGLGIGALLGAHLEKYPKHLLRLFIGFELLIGLFGLVSQSIINWLGSFTHIDSLWSIGLCSYLVFGFPTLLMGATLPLLVSYINQRVGHTGKSLALLYASNTFGAAAAAFVTVKIFFVFFGLHTTIMIAVFINVTTAIVAFLLYHKLPLTNDVEPLIKNELSDTQTLLNASPKILYTLSFLLGYVALSQELIWYRVLGFLSSNSPVIFGLMLTAFLIGIGDSALKSSKAYVSQAATVRYIFTHLVGLLCVWFIAFPITAEFAAFFGKFVGLLMGFLLTAVVAFLCGGIFPVLCHLLQQSTSESAGSVVGKMYFANVMGATIGPLCTGFIVFEYFSLQSSVSIIGLIIAVIILFLAAISNLEHRIKYAISGACIAISLTGFALQLLGYEQFFGKLQFGMSSPPPLEAFHSNRNGIIDIVETSVYGNGAYDGKMNIDPYNDTNGIKRAYAIPTFHPNPKRILLIGLSGGSWTQVLAFYTPLEQITAVEINKGYLDVISRYPDHADILRNPKVKIEIDDGRRWVRNHPDEKFDVIVMNTIYYWRSNATNMLSKQFFELCKQRLKPGGYLFINNTGAKEVAYTAAHVFDYVSVAFEGKMVIAGDAPADISKASKITNLQQFIYNDGQAVFKNDEVLNDIASMAFPNHKEEIVSQKDLLVITDDNMATEFKKPNVFQ